MTIQIYNTLSRQKQPFVPLQEGKISMYVCGMTVYDYCHIGHARVMVAFDVITRYLRFKGFQVEYVRNITDVDDKIIARAAANNESPQSLTQRFIQAMQEDEAKLSVLPPSQQPKATDHIHHIIDMIQVLMDKGYAYQGENGDVFFRINKFADYGKLTNRKLDELLAGARIEIEHAKENPCDFVLWKQTPKEEMYWESPWGKGRPGWHIECSAMSKQCLGDHFDIHGGGPDLPFPHHENEIAQSEAANGTCFVNYWLHAGAVRVNQEKMSKSLGNFFTIRDVLKQHPAEVVRYLLTASHYRSQIDYAEDSLNQAHKALERFYTALLDVPALDWMKLQNTPDVIKDKQAQDYLNGFSKAMDDDFNTRKALTVMFDMAKEINRLKQAERIEQAARLAALLRYLGYLLGILQMDPKGFLHSTPNAEGLSDADIDALVQQRDLAKQNKDFSQADSIRTQLINAQVILEDTRMGTRWKRSL